MSLTLRGVTLGDLLGFFFADPASLSDTITDSASLTIPSSVSESDDEATSGSGLFTGVGSFELADSSAVSGVAGSGSGSALSTDFTGVVVPFLAGVREWDSRIAAMADVVALTGVVSAGIVLLFGPGERVLTGVVSAAIVLLFGPGDRILTGVELVPSSDTLFKGVPPGVRDLAGEDSLDVVPFGFLPRPFFFPVIL